MEVKAYKTKKAPDPGASCGSDLPQKGVICERLADDRAAFSKKHDYSEFPYVYA